jgi:cytoskeletal protein RodZ
MNSIGETIRRERLKRGWDLEQIARSTKISGHWLEAIESGQFDKLPGGVFTRSFVRQYARALGIDDHEIDSELRRILEPAAPEPLQRTPPAMAQAKSPARSWLAAVRGWSIRGWSWPARSSWPTLALLGVLIAISSLYTAIQNRRIAPSEPLPLQSSGASSEAGTPAITPTGGVANQSVFAAARADFIELTASSEAWVSIYSGDKQLFTGVLEAEETKIIPVPGPVQIRVGDAGAVSLRWNGKALGPVGRDGQIKVVRISGDGNMEQVEAQQPAAPPLQDLY